MHDAYCVRAPAGALALACLAACPDSVPGDTDGAAATSSTSDAATTTAAPPVPTTGFVPLCLPGQTRCHPEQPNVLQTCKDTGAEWEATACEHACVDDIGSAACVGPCDTGSDPSSLGCEFIAIRMDSHNAGPDIADALIVGNVDPDELAAVQLYFTPTNEFDEQPVLDPVILAPGESHVFDITGEEMAFTHYRTGGVFRVVSDRPIAAYLHSPLANDASNDASMLLPVRWLGKDYVVASWPPFVDADEPDANNGRPSYFTVIALEDDTTVTWTPRWPTGLGGLIDLVMPGETGHKTLQRFDVLQVAASSPPLDTDYERHDVSGTLVRADKNIWVMGATDCAYVPFGSGWCNHLQEQMIPLEYWGTTYIGPPSPPRSGEEKQYWRVYAGADDILVSVKTSQSADVYPLAERGEFRELEIPAGESVLFTGLNDAPILPVQYLAGNQAAGQIGDPAMVQLISAEQWRDRYVFVTGADYEANFVQVVRRTNGADVTIDGQPVGAWKLANFIADDNYQYADVPLPGGSDALTHVAASSEPFGITVVGYNPAGPGTKTSAYAYPGGMRLVKLFQP
ncbi:IgGFc-binding protein [Nannocystis radixulma]|uniref:IgGFc-binding protein n=1 Tax=Nannocystis radixulma TaxID=2995305 RepID=A0ABT5B3K4_9BACT|nr:IgGFc-binding protein [Nannocystis radixulma]MDC0668683.1 IgGFc-binding protein [Nannocystis radixulma]